MFFVCICVGLYACIYCMYTVVYFPVCMEDRMECWVPYCSTLYLFLTTGYNCNWS